MYGLGRYLCVLCVLNVEACGAGTAVGESPGGSTLGAAQVDVDQGVGRSPPSFETDAEGRPSSNSDFPDDDESTPDSTQPCTCGNSLPGITIEEEDGQLIVAVALTSGTSVAIRVNGQNCGQSAQGLSLTGDVEVQLGPEAEVPLVAADLTVSASAGAGVAIQGSAQVPQHVLGDLICPSDLVDARAELALGVSSGDVATLDLSLAPTALTLDTRGLPFGAGTIAVVHPTIVLSSSAQGQQIEVRGSLGADAISPWLGALPLAPTGELAVKARIVDQSSLQVALEGDLQLTGNSLVCGVTPLRAAPLPSASIAWNSEGIGLQANAGGGLYPAASVLGNVDLAASFAPNAWRIKVCGDAVLGVSTDGLEAIDCLELSKEGAAVCSR